jgi:hypothetical protein
MDPFQSKMDSAGPYTLYYIEYMPDTDTSYTSTQPMTNLTVIAVPSANTAIITDIDEILTDAAITAESAS